MKLPLNRQIGRRSLRAYTLAEVIVTIFLIAIGGISLYAGFSSGFQVVQSTQENLRATQIMVQWMETSRIYTFSQLKTNAYVPTVFVDRYDPNSTTNKGTIFVVSNYFRVPPNLPAEYGTNMVEYTISVTWTNYVGKKAIEHKRYMQTYCASAGLQKYVFVK